MKQKKAQRMAVVQRMKQDLDRMFDKVNMSQAEQVALRQSIVQLTNMQIAMGAK